MRVSRCNVVGLSSQDNDRYSAMCRIVEECEKEDIEPPMEAIEYIKRYDRGEEESLVMLRPGIDKGVSLRTYDEESAIVINLNEINPDIDVIRIQHEEFEE